MAYGGWIENEQRVVASIEASNNNGICSRFQIHSDKNINQNLIHFFTSLDYGTSWEGFNVYGGTRQSETQSDKVKEIGMFKNDSGGVVLRGVFNKTGINSELPQDIRMMDLHINKSGLILVCSEDGGQTWTEAWRK